MFIYWFFQLLYWAWLMAWHFFWCFLIGVGLKRLKIPRGIIVFVSFALFGIISGTLAVLYRNNDGQNIINLPGALLGEWVYDYVIRYYGYPSSGLAHFAMPWITRVPQVALYTSSAFWWLLGLLVQAGNNLRKKERPFSPIKSFLVASFLLLLLIVIISGILYAFRQPLRL
jgi:hypothetical protein